MKMKRPIYLDYAATTPIDPRVKQEMCRYMDITGIFGNPSSYSHSFGQEANWAVEDARNKVAQLINANPQEIIWTSGATESNNLAIKGATDYYANRGKHIVTSSIEHKAVLDSCTFLASRGFKVTYVTPGKDGIIKPDMVEKVLRNDTILVSLMHVNNEIGTITDIDTIGRITRERNIFFHVDAAQSANRLAIDTRSIQADYISISGHKIYGPKGIGALYIRRRPQARLSPQIHGGGHEGGIRSGTLPTHQIVGMGEAAMIVIKERESEALHVKKLAERLLNNLKKCEAVFINGDRRYCVPGILSVSFDCVKSDSLMMSMNDIALSSGSACRSSNLEISHVLRSLGLSEDMAHSTLRFSIGRFSTADDIDYVSKKMYPALMELRALSPRWLGSHRNAATKLYP